MLYDNWIHKLSESYTNSKNINEEESGHHPMVHKAADHIHSVLDQYYANHPKEKTLKTITGALKGQEVTRDSVVAASKEAILDHYGIGGHSYEVNDDVPGDHSEHPDWEELEDNAAQHVQDSLWKHLGEPEKKEVKESTLTESEMILEELNETKEYVNILENVLETLLENDIITEEDIVNIMEVLTPNERYNIIFKKTGDINKAIKAKQKRKQNLQTTQGMSGTARQDPRPLSIEAGSDPDRGLWDRAAIGGIQPANAEEILNLRAQMNGLAPPSSDVIDRFRQAVAWGRKVRASERKWLVNRGAPQRRKASQ